MTAMSIWPGSPSPLGATLNGSGVNFALFSEHATKVKLCLFDSPDATLESHRIALPEKTNQVWHVCLPVLLSASLHERFTHVPQSNSSLPTRSASIRRAAGGVPFSPPPGNRSGLPDGAAMKISR
jgi:pullulanase/glycogen debranching enzyme